jgi:hypothetical protein
MAQIGEARSLPGSGRPNASLRALAAPGFPVASFVTSGTMPDELRRTLWGYFFWGLMGLVILVPELFAAIRPKDVPWPTISGTVGYLEYWHEWVSLIVVGVIAWWALHVVQFGPQKVGVLSEDQTNPGRSYRRTPHGRSTRAKALRGEFRARVYIPLALAGVLLAAVSVQVKRPEDEYLLGEVLYSAIALFWIVIPGVAAYFWGKEVPFPTLFTTFRHLASLDRLKLLAGLIAGGILVLLIHLALYPWPASISDIQDLHEQNEDQRRIEKKENEPSAFAL